MKKLLSKRTASTKGFTLIELLVVIAIIGLLSTLAVVSLNSARQKARDAKRVADIKQVQTALELYLNDQNEYPETATDGTMDLGEGADCSSAACTCLNDLGWSSSADCSSGTNTYMGLVPSNPQPGGATFVYAAEQAGGGGDCTVADVSAICESYTITFSLESAIPSLGAGTSCTASPVGVICT